MLAGCQHGLKRAEIEEPRTLRVMTYNIHHAAGMDGKVDIRRIAHVINAQKPDLVAIQEVDRCTTRVSGMDQPAELARLTGLHAHFSPAFELMGGHYGQVILSRYPIGDVETVMLPRIKDEQRIAIIAEILRPSAPARFIATHLTHNNEEERIGQVDALWKKVYAVSAWPTVLAGDFNSKPGSRPITKILEGFDDTTGDAALTSPSVNPKHKIDWILCQKVHRWSVMSANVVENDVASDHRAVIVELVQPLREH